MDSDQLGHLIDRHASALVLFARQWCVEAEDVVQDAFVGLAGLRKTPDHPEAWLFRAVRNGAINAGKAGQRRRRHEAKAASTPEEWFEADPTTSLLDPDAAQVALSALPIDQREIVVAHLWGGLTFNQIAHVTGSSSSGVHRLYHAALSVLRQRLGIPCPTKSRPT